MRSGYKWVLYILIFAVTANLINRYKEQKHNLERIKEENLAISSVNHELNDIKRSATEKYPEMPLSESISLESSNRAKNSLNSESNENKKTISAASMFMGFYNLNVRVRPEFCREQGVDISPFVLAFERENSIPFAKARAVFSKAPPLMEEKVFAMLKSKMRESIVQDMNELASISKISLKEACQLLADNGDSAAADMHISKVQPDVFRVLSNN